MSSYNTLKGINTSIGSRGFTLKGINKGKTKLNTRAFPVESSLNTYYVQFERSAPKSLKIKW